MGEASGEHGFFMERQYYVGNTYNSQAIGAWAVTVEDGTFVIYANATYTDQVTGALTRLKRSVGRGQVAKGLRAHFEKLRADVEAGN